MTKLFAAAALWFGHQHFLDFAVIAGLLGGALTLAIVLGRNVPLPEILARQGWLARLHDTKEGVPYGIALAAGALIVYPQTGWMAAIASSTEGNLNDHLSFSTAFCVASSLECAMM